MRSLLLVFLVATSASASEWQTYAGGFSSRWHTTGHHGHDQPSCGSPVSTTVAPGVILTQGVDCNTVDFERANLDDSIGFRAGAERDLLAKGPLRITAGGDVGISHTEYNLSQTDFALLNAMLVTGADFQMRGIRAGVRVGGGAFTTTDHQGGIAWEDELSLSVPVRAGAALRLSRRRSTYTRQGRDESVPATETALMLVATSEAPNGRSPWEFSVAAGTTTPGRGPGDSLALHKTAWQRLTVLHDLKSPSTQFALTWTSTAQESGLLSDFRGYGGNERGKTINGLGFGLVRSVAATENLSARFSGGIEVADWGDPYPLLVSHNLQTLHAGVEGALTAAGALRYGLRPGLSAEAGVQQVYWNRLHLGETRWGIGIALTR